MRQHLLAPLLAVRHDVVVLHPAATQFTLQRDRKIHEAKVVFQKKRLAAVRMAERTTRNALTAFDPALIVPPYAPVRVLLQAMLSEDLRARPADPFTKVAGAKLRAMAERLRRRPGAPAVPPDAGSQKAP